MSLNILFVKQKMIPLSRTRINNDILKRKLFNFSLLSSESRNHYENGKLSNSKLWRTINTASFCSSSERSHEQLLVQSYGEPEKVVVKEKFSLPKDLGKKQVIVKVLASPVNPADINTIQGVYAIKPDLPFVPGGEAVMEVVDTGSDVKNLRTGDRVIPKLRGMGTWRTAIVGEDDEFIKIPSDIDIITASTIAINPCTAYRMLIDFVELKPGDVVIQNCANSAVGQAVIQIAAAKGIRTVNVVRPRLEFEELKKYLTSLGATLVISDSELRTNREWMNELPQSLLALNGVSGKEGRELIGKLADGGTMVTYGGMARKPMSIPAGSLIFKDVSLRGFWMNRWTKLHVNHPERTSMLNYLFDLSRKGKLQCARHNLVPFEEYTKALEQAMPFEGKVGKKQILVFK